ncbi:hypothetical protein B5P45_11905 [Phyllobacterium zundukense]|uniref:Uncharacterized protein n=1 Tax=Phyllobacterium zundukense TaxID=1867719 RepID=A0A2N9VYK2_9HYPH|nr:hypothetical protein BLM14_25770 [Phyllobacterium zundukense]PIO44570.1 hypothetical protein B5P45_11905 [Phyllobacterium zundukense]
MTGGAEKGGRIQIRHGDPRRMLLQDRDDLHRGLAYIDVGALFQAGDGEFAGATRPSAFIRAPDNLLFPPMLRLHARSSSLIMS